MRRAATFIGCVALAAALPAFANQIRKNSDGSVFIVSTDPRARPRMGVDAVIALAHEGQRRDDPESRTPASIRRIDLVLAEDVNAILPRAPFQDSMRGRWVWIVQLLGRFQGGGGPSTPDYEGRQGWFLLDDGSRAIVAWGFTKDKLVEKPAAGSD